MNIIGCIPRFLKKNAGWILTGLSCAGVVGTAVLVAEEAPIAKAALEEAGKDEELSVFEKIDIAAPIYLPAALVGLTTIGCMIGAQIFNVKQQAALVAAYAMLGEQFAQYRKEVRNEIGEEREKQLYISSQKKIKELQAEIKRLEEKNEPGLYGISTLPGVIFEADREHIANVFYHMTYNMLTCGGISLLELYDHIGLPKSTFNAEEASNYGWCTYENEVTYGCSAIEFEIIDVKRADGKTVHVINFSVAPYELGLDYGGADSSVDHMYDGYDCERTFFLAQASVDSDVERFEQPDIWIQHIW